MTTEEKMYDIILFGVTGFTGKLAVEYLLNKNIDSLKWAACARNESRAQAVLNEIVKTTTTTTSTPPLIIANLICSNEEEEEILRSVVKSTRVVLTTAGPFEKYGITLHKLCAEEGVHYADITGETSFVRQMIDQHDDIARRSDAILVSHCGNDCIPQDLTVYEMNKYAKGRNCTLKQVLTVDEFPPEASFSGGTLSTAMYQLSKPKHTKSNTNNNKDNNKEEEEEDKFDPLVKTMQGTKSEYQTKVIHKSTQYHSEFNRSAGPWIMGPVMANCVRRSNAILGYSSQFQYGDAKLTDPSWSNWFKECAYAGLIGAALYAKPLQKLLPQPGEGPDRATMEAGYLKLHGRGIMVDDKTAEEIPLYSLFHFHHDTAYLMTAQLLVETGLLLVQKDKTNNKTLSLEGGGVVTPAVAFGSELTEHITKEMDCTFELKETPFTTEDTA